MHFHPKAQRWALCGGEVGPYQPQPIDASSHFNTEWTTQQAWHHHRLPMTQLVDAVELDKSHRSFLGGDFAAERTTSTSCTTTKRLNTKSVSCTAT